MQNSACRLAVIGLGMASKPHLEALQELSGSVTVSGIYNRSPAPAKKLASATGYRVFQSIEDIAADTQTDGVIVITPPNQRQEITQILSSAGKHILMEKPVERSTAAAVDIVRQCEQAKVKLGIVFQHRFRVGAQRLRELLAQNALGEIKLVRADIPWWRDQAYYDVPGRGSYERDGGGVLISQAIHVLDTMLSLTGPAKCVQAMTATTPFHQMESEDFATAGLQFHSGAVGSVVATTATYPGGTESLTLDGTLGTATLNGGQLQINWRDGRTEALGEESGTGGGTDPMAFPCDWHRDLIADFAAAIQQDTDPAITGRSALAVHALIDAIVASARSGQITPVETLS